MIVDVQGFGPVEFPDSMHPDDVKNVLRQKFPQIVPTGSVQGYKQPGLVSYGTGNPLQPLVAPGPNTARVNEQIFGGFGGGAVTAAQGALSGATTPALAAAPLVGEVPGAGPALLRGLGLGVGGYMGYQQGRQFQREGVNPNTLGQASVNLPLATLSVLGGLQPLPERPAVPPRQLGNGPIPTIYDPNPQVMDLPGRPMPGPQRPQLGFFPTIEEPRTGLPPSPPAPKQLPPPSSPESGQAKASGGGAPPSPDVTAAKLPDEVELAVSEAERRAASGDHEGAENALTHAWNSVYERVGTRKGTPEAEARRDAWFDELNRRQDAIRAKRSPAGAAVARELGLIKGPEWDKSLPKIGGTYSLTDPKTGISIEGISPATPKEEILKRFAASKVKPTPVTREKAQEALHDLAGVTTTIQLGGFPPDVQQQLTKERDGLMTQLANQVDVSETAKAFRNKVQQQYASRITSTKGVPSQQVRPGVDAQTPLRQQGQAAPTQVQGQTQVQVPPLRPIPQTGLQPTRGGVPQPGNRPGPVVAQKANDVSAPVQKGLTDQQLYNQAVIRPEVELPNGQVAVGEQGQTHGDILVQHGFKESDVPHEDPRRRFNISGRKYNRIEAEAATGLKGTASAGGLDSMDIVPGGKTGQVQVLPPKQPTMPEVFSAATKAENKLEELGYDWGTKADGGIAWVTKDGKLVPKAEIPKEVTKSLNQIVKSNKLAKSPTIGTGIKAALAKNKELGALNLGPAVDAFETARDKLAIAIAASPVKTDLYRDADVADNAARLVGDKGGNSLELLAKTTFGPVADQALKGVTAAMDTLGDKTKLDQFIQVARTAGDKQAEAAATFAKNNWDRLQPLVKRARALHNLGLQALLRENVDISERPQYNQNTYDENKLKQSQIGPFLQGNFKTLYDAVGQGYGKAITSWNSASIVQRALTSDFQKANRLQWVKAFASVNDPTTGLPVVSLKERPDYTRFSLLGPSFWIHRGYRQAFDAAVSMSWLREHVVPLAFLKVVGNTKHFLLAFDSYHLVKVEAFNLSLTGSFGYKRGLSVLEYNPGDLNNAVRAGALTQEMADEVNKVRPVGNLAIRAGLNIGQVSQKMDSEVADLIPVIGTSRKWIFEKVGRGAMMNSFIEEFKRLAPDRYGVLTSGGPEEPGDLVLAKKISRDLNYRFGNLGRQGLLKSKTAQDVSRLMLLAPQWVESMMNSEARSVGQIAKYPITKGKMGTLGKSTGVLLLGAFVGVQLANYLTIGHSTFENPEEHRLDAWVPGFGKNNPGYWVSPMTIPMEMSHDVYRYYELGDSPMQIGAQILGNKMAPYMRAGEVLVTGRDFAGRPLTDMGRLEAAGLDVLPAPLAVQAATKGLPQLQRQGIASIGFKVEPAERPNAQMARLSRAYNESKGVKEGSYPESDYNPIKLALERDEVDKAKEEYQKLLVTKKKQLVKDPAKEVELYFHDLSDHKFTGSATREDDFYASLSEERKKVYQAARAHNKELADKFFAEVLGHPDKPKKQRRFSAFQQE